MDPVDVTPLRRHPDTIPDPDRRRAHARRYDAQHAADHARNDVLDTMTQNGVTHADAQRLTDALIMAVRQADALRLEHARGVIRDDDAWWHGIGDLNAAVAFLYETAHAYPAQTDRT